MVPEQISIVNVDLKFKLSYFTTLNSTNRTDNLNSVIEYDCFYELAQISNFCSLSGL